MNLHHKLLEELGHLKDRERVLIGENDQLRAQLVEMKEQEKKKYDDLMVQYNMKREYEDEGTSNNQVTVKTEWDHEEVKVEIIEEDEDNEDSGWDRCVVKKEEVEDQIEDWVKREMKEEEEKEEDGSAEIDSIDGWAESNQSGDDECQALDNVPLNTTLTHPTGQSQLTVTQSADLLSPQTSTAQTDNPTVINQQATASTQDNKRKQQTSKRSVKRLKPTIEEDDGDDGEDEEDIADDDREESKIKVLNLNCTQSNCNVKLDSMALLHDHLSTVHQLSPLQCFATNCNARFDERTQISVHIQLHHSRNTRFLCSVCHREYGSQHKTYNHWYNYHLTGQFNCNFVSDCAQVTDTRRKMQTHQRTKHLPQANHFNCTQPGCTSSFSCNARLKLHQLTHLNTNQFHCNWPHCSKQCKQRSNLIMHIRMCHFGLPKSMKAQKEKNIVDLRDPNEYVRVVVDE